MRPGWLLSGKTRTEPREDDPVTFSYNPPGKTLAEIMHDAMDVDEEAAGENPAEDSARLLHEKLMLHGQRHTLESDTDSPSGRRDVVLRIPAATALWLASVLDGAWTPPTY